MIDFEDVSLLTRVGWNTQPIVRNVSLQLPSNKRIALLGGLPEERNAIMNLIGGVLIPNSGRITREVRTSFPTTLSGAFDAALSLRENVEFVSSIYNVDSSDLLNFLASVVDFGSDQDIPLRNLPRDIRKQFSQIIALSIPFDLYVVNGLFGGGPKPLRDAALQLFAIRKATSGIIFNARDIDTAGKNCEMALVLKNQTLLLLNSISEAGLYID
jgi:capsular polysaccharide transport system ATP-binding protein